MIAHAGRRALIKKPSLRRSSLFFTPRILSSPENSHPQFTSLIEPSAAIDVPRKPTFAPELRTFTEIVHPKDACILFLRPDINDVIVTALANGSPISGKPEYRVISQSPISGSFLKFANVVIDWMEQTAAGITELLPISGSLDKLRYTETDNSQGLDELYHEKIWNESDDKTKSSGVANGDPLEVFFNLAAQSGITLEKAAGFLLNKAHEIDKFARLFSYISEQDCLLQYLSSFTSKVVNVVYGSQSAEKYRIFAEYLASRVKYFGKSTIELVERSTEISFFSDLEPECNDKLVSIISAVAQSLDQLANAKDALLALIHEYKVRPLKELLGVFLSNFCIFASEEGLSRKQILLELAPLKPAIISIELPEDAFLFFMRNLMTTSYDFSHFLKNISATSPVLLQKYVSEVLLQLKQIQQSECVLGVLARVQLAQVGKILIESGVNRKTYESLIEGSLQ